MCVTDGKFIGLVPAYAKKGDVVFVARGVQAPLLLRRIDAPPGSRVRKEGLWHYTLVGECYIHGIMDGVYGPDMDVEIF
ncbi:hypothetical protein DL98DRAFT_518471 [Cadophora sp. DSE1049]|nr:hypothetical protein DL98DRAFT_518471 [Cadophora sp. DSE1049]